MTHVSLGETQLVSKFVQAILYGIYLVTAGNCARALLAGRNDIGKRILFIGVAIAMLIVVSLNIIVCLRYILVTYVSSGGSLGPDGGFGVEATATLDIIQVVLVLLCTSLATANLVLSGSRYRDDDCHRRRDAGTVPH